MCLGEPVFIPISRFKAIGANVGQLFRLQSHLLLMLSLSLRQVRLHRLESQLSLIEGSFGFKLGVELLPAMVVSAGSGLAGRGNRRKLLSCMTRTIPVATLLL